jgi:hypothetical protein
MEAKVEMVEYSIAKGWDVPSEELFCPQGWARWPIKEERMVCTASNILWKPNGYERKIIMANVNQWLQAAKKNKLVDSKGHLIC